MEHDSHLLLLIAVNQVNAGHFLSHVAAPSLLASPDARVALNVGSLVGELAIYEQF